MDYIYDVTGIKTCDKTIVYDEKIVLCGGQNIADKKCKLERRLSLKHNGDVQVVFKRLATLETVIKPAYQFCYP